VEEKEDLSSIGIAFGEGKEVKIVVSYVEVLRNYQCSGFFASAGAESFIIRRKNGAYIDAFIGKAGRDCRRLLFCFGK
jgi:hypothetical protein